jgi:colanic acid/amylovoran biosynthesis glycosyltransferase
MKIAYLTSEYPAPSHTFIRREISALRAEGANIVTFSIHRPPAAARLSDEDRQARAETGYVIGPSLPILCSIVHAVLSRPISTVLTLRYALRHRVPGLRALIWSIFHFVEALHLARMLRAQGVGHVHNHFANSSAIVGMLAAMHLGIGFSLTVHGISEFDGPAGALLHEKVRACRFVACVSSFGRAQVMRLVDPKEWPKLFISRCGLHTVARPRRAERTGRIRFCSVGRLSPEKGQAGLLDAFRVTLNDGVDAELHLVGGGPLRGELERRAASLGLSDRVVFHGQLTEEEVAAVMATSDVFVMSSFMEGLPVVIMEAFAASVPVVAPGVAGIPELVIDGQTGFLFPPSDWDALSDAMTRLAKDPGLRARVGERGRRKVAEQHELAHVVRPLLAQFAALGLVREASADQSGSKRRIDLEDRAAQAPAPGAI